MIDAIVATYGDRERWDRLAERAVGSLEAQSVRPKIHRVHGDTLAQARNAGAAEAKGTHLLFLDADDVLDSFYVEAMLKAADWSSINTMFQPATSALFPDGTTDENPSLIPPRVGIPRAKALHYGNHLVIGTVVPRWLFERAGGFWEEPMMEDWSLWLRCFALGGFSIPVPEAVYYVFQSPTPGRNSGPPPGIFDSIIQSYRQWCAQQGLDP